MKKNKYVKKKKKKTIIDRSKRINKENHVLNTVRVDTDLMKIQDEKQKEKKDFLWCFIFFIR